MVPGMTLRHLARLTATRCAGLLAGLALATSASAAPVALDLAFGTASGNGQWSAGQGLQAYTGSAPLNVGAVDQRNVLYFVEEQRVGDLQSWYLFFDPAATQRVRATIDFGAAIEQVFTTRQALLESQPLYANPAFEYGTSLAMGLEAEDLVSWTAGASTLDLLWLTADPGDHVRVLVRVAGDDPQAVPEPGSLALALGALAALGGFARTRRNRSKRQAG